MQLVKYIQTGDVFACRSLSCFAADHIRFVPDEIHARDWITRSV